jgi:hypothetical protein
MDYKLYTLVDITHTGQYRIEPGKELDRYKEQNFDTIIQTLGLRSNIFYRSAPNMLEVGGRVVGFETDEIIRVWRFDWSVERDDLYLKGNDPVGFLKDDFHLIPYISGLNELLEQKYSVFNSLENSPNIVFQIKQ